MEENKLKLDNETFKKEYLNNNTLVLLEFYGTWCMPCKMEAGILDKIEEAHKDDVKVIRLDSDINIDMAKEYSAMTVPTMVLFKNGFECEKMVGFRQFKQIDEIIKKYKD